MEKERLLYSLVQVPLEMIQDDERRSLVKPFSGIRLCESVLPFPS